MYADGASKGNPGESAVGVVCLAQPDLSLRAFKENPEAATFFISQRLGVKTNNEAEYLALIAGLQELKSRGLKGVQVYMDSELVVRQVRGEYKVKKEGLKPLHQQAKILLMETSSQISHLPREKNQIADYLANMAYM